MSRNRCGLPALGLLQSDAFARVGACAGDAIDLRKGAAPRAISPKGVSWPFAVAPDGSAVAAACGDQIVVYPLNGGESKAIEKTREGERVVAWSGDGTAVFVCGRGRVSADIARIEIASGQRSLWHTIQPSDPAGIMGIYPVKITPDGERYVYGYRRSLTDLFIVRGLLS